MSSINGKLGLKPAGKRSFMNLPKNLSERVVITSAKCPLCGRTGARPSKLKPGQLYFPCCNVIAEPS